MNAGCMKTAVNPSRKSVRGGFRDPGFASVTVLGFIFISCCPLGFTQAAPLGSPVAKVRVGVLGLFHPRQLTISATEGNALVVRAGDERIVMESSSGEHTAIVRLSGSEIILRSGTRIVHAPALTVAGRKNDTVDFVLAVPGKIARHYRGTLEIHASAEYRSGGHLLAVV